VFKKVGETAKGGLESVQAAEQAKEKPDDIRWRLWELAHGRSVVYIMVKSCMKCVNAATTKPLAPQTEYFLFWFDKNPR